MARLHIDLDLGLVGLGHRGEREVLAPELAVRVDVLAVVCVCQCVFSAVQATAGA